MNYPKSQLRFNIKSLPLGIVLLVALFSFVFLSNSTVLAKEVEKGKDKKIETYERLKTFSEILSLLEMNYVEDVDNRTLVDGAIRGMLKTLDPHTSYLPPVSFQEMKVETSGKFGGLGIEISMRKGVLTVISPIADTPADKAGILAQDKIIKIEDESTLDMTLSEAVEKLRGKRGTSVRITIYRESLKEPKEFTIVRDIIKVQSVKNKVFHKNIGYISIRSFTKTTSSDLDAALEKLEKQNITKLILDLRNNPGGLLNQAVEVSDRFLEKENLIVYTKGRTEDQNMRFTTREGVKTVNYPMIVIVNGGSASASEIVAGALQDLGRAVILGTPTFGKGSVQTIIPLSDGSALRLTTARYYTPSGRIIQENGIDPDILVELPPVTAKLDDDKSSNNKSEKEKMRRFLREKDLKKHLKGKKGDGTDAEDTEDPAAKDAEDDAKISKAEEEELKKDYQLRQAVLLLAGWDVMKSSLKTSALSKELE